MEPAIETPGGVSSDPYQKTVAVFAAADAGNIN
jgi:hypothetical protein